ncbi:hypothetical protein, partial [Mesorhizobium sp. M0698]|uniref:hypothetical protein n=1 Tax=Mesorhizobium sp. M0698 TaxID=2956987 RepID=UPI003336B719
MRMTKHAPCQIRKPFKAVDKSGSAMLRIRHCLTSDRAERDARAAENIFFVRKTIGRAAGEGYRMRFEWP